MKNIDAVSLGAVHTHTPDCRTKQIKIYRK